MLFDVSSRLQIFAAVDLYTEGKEWNTRNTKGTCLSVWNAVIRSVMDVVTRNTAVRNAVPDIIIILQGTGGLSGEGS